MAPRVLLEPALGTKLDIVALHVLAPDAIPAFTDQPCHEQEAWAREFLARYCRWGIAGVRLVTRVGRREDQVARAARDFGCDMVVMGWSQRLAGNHARVVRATLERSDAPVMLFPVARTWTGPTAQAQGSLGGAGPTPSA
jgi:nucleotide-binding universal stress UspA family protein